MYLINGTLSASLPFRLHLADGRTRTSLHEMSEEQLAELNIYPVDEIKPPLTWTQHYGAPVIEVTDGRATATYPVLDYSADEVAGVLEAAKSAKRAEIAAARWAEETAPFFYGLKDASFDTSERSQIKYLRAYEKGDTVMWKTTDAGWVEMTQEDFAGLIGAYEAFVASLFAKEAGIQVQIGMCDTEEQLELIIWEEE